jgi:anaerobic magnesium-protoporphyrin IX monomethyl ester cyclase
MRYSRVLLVAPRFNKGKHRLAVHPLTGLGYLVEFLKAAGIMVTVIDMNLGYNDHDLHRKIFEFRPDLIGFMVMTFDHRNVYKTIETIKQKFPQVNVIAGGPHVSIMRRKVLEDCQAIDYAVFLEGEEALSLLCKGAGLEDIPGLIYHKGAGICINPGADFIVDLDKIPFPMFKEFELQKYPVKQIGIISSRGCPYDCIYCPVESSIGKKFRHKSAAAVVKEIEYWYNEGYRQILLLDDNFTLVRRRVEDICDTLISKHLQGLRLKCPNGVRADKVDYALLVKMKEAGFDMVAFGVEAGVDRVLENIKKGEVIKQIERSISDACHLGFDVDLFFLLGSPGETPEDVNASFSLALRYPVRNANFYNIVPFPTTELYNWLKNNGYFLYALEHILNNSSHFVNEPCFYTPEMSRDERRKAFRRAQAVSRKVKKLYFQRKLTGPLFFRKVLSWLYTFPAAERLINNNAPLMKLKEGISGVLLNNGPAA